MTDTAHSPPRDPTRVKPFAGTPLKLPALPRQSRLEWAPLAGPQNVSFSGTDYDAVRKALIGMWGTFPIRLSKERGDDECMKAMMFAAGQGQTPYHVLHQALMQYGEIEVRDL